MTDALFAASFVRRVPTLVLVGLALLVPLVTSATAQEVMVPVETQLALFPRILAFDRAFDHRRDKDLVIGILYQERFRASLNVKNLLIELSERDTATRQPIHRYVPIDMTEAGALRAALAHHSIDVLYVAPLRAVNIDDIVAVSREHSILTYTGVPEYVKQGVAVGIGARGGRPHILINLTAARAEGADFSSELLKLAQIVDGS